MTNLLRAALELPRRLMHPGEAGDAGVAGARRIASNVGIQVVARVITMVVGILTVALTARTLLTEGYGVWTGVSNYVGLFSVLTDLGFVTIATQRMAAEPDQEGKWLAALVGVRIGASIIVAGLCAASVPLLLRSTDHSHAVAYIMAATMLSAGAASLLTVYESRLRSGVALSYNVLQWLLWLVAVVILHVEHASVVVFAAVNTTLLFFIAGLQIRAGRRSVEIAWREGLRLWQSLVRQAVPLGVASIMMAIYYQVDSVLLLQIAGARETGIYGAAYSCMSPLIFMPAAIMGSLFPVLAAIHESDPERTRRIVQTAAEIMAIVALPALAGSIALSSPIIRFIYGPGFERSAALVPILMIAFVTICFGTLAGNLSILLELRWRFALYATIGAIANVTLNLILIPPYGAHGSAWATVATEGLSMALMLGTSLRRMRLRLRLGRMARAVVLMAAMTGVMLLARPLGLFPAGILGLLAYGAGLPALRIFGREELRTFRLGAAQQLQAEPAAAPR